MDKAGVTARLGLAPDRLPAMRSVPGDRDRVRLRPVWPQPRPRPSRALPRRAEVVIVGGGITGVALLRHLAARGVDAVLLEREHLAAGASGRNAGFLLQGVAESYAAAARRYGRDVARAVWELTADNHRRLLELAGGAPIGHARRGSLTVATSEEERDDLHLAESLLREDGFAARYLEGPPVLGPAIAGHRGGLLNPDDGEVVPTAAVTAVAAAQRGRVHERTRVVAVQPGHSGVLVCADRGEVECGSVVLATNAWTSHLAAAVAVRPVRAQMLASAPWPAPVAARPVYAEWGFQYWRQLDDGRVLVGGFRNRTLGAEVGYEVTPTAAVQGHLEDHLRALGVAARVAHRWAGTMGFSPDGLPLVGPVPGHPAVHVCAGYSGHGFGFAVECARILVEHLLDARPIPAWLVSTRASVVEPAALSRT